jgi:CheY-like chemotaxis protein
MNALLIHNDNLPSSLILNFPNAFKFNISQSKMLEDGFSFDKEAHVQLAEALIKKQFDVIFIPYTLSNQNYLELSGIRLALHIRLTSEFNHSRVPIIFIGHELKEQIAKVTEFTSFLFTKGIFNTQKFDLDAYHKQYEWIEKEWKPDSLKPILNDNEYLDFINKIKVDSPANYQSHHSVDNEITLLKWSEYLGCDDEIPQVKENIKSALFFKFLRIKYPNETTLNIQNYSIKEKAKILLIDDEAAKGWTAFYHSFLKDTIQFQSLVTDFNLNSKELIIYEAIEKVKELDPDVILLDLRLCDNDFYQSEDSELTGLKIIEEIKKISKGIQVVIVTASNKSWNFEAAFKKGADFYILKQVYNDTQKAISNLFTIIRESIKRSKTLKPIVFNFTFIQNLAKGLSKEFLERLEVNLSICFDLLVKSFEIEKYRNYAYLQLYLIVEEFIKEESIFEMGTDCYVITPNNRFLVFSNKKSESKDTPNESAILFNHGHYKISKTKTTHRIDTNFITSAILLFRYGLNTSGEKNWSKIYTIRNDKAAHPEKDIVSFSDIELLVSFLKFIFNNENIKEVDINLALTEVNIEDRINNLNEKFK